MLLDGLFVPVTTPFYPDGASYWRKLEHNVARYSRTPAAGLVVLGRNSEAAGLNDIERRESLKIVGETAAPEKVLIACAGAESVRGALDLAEQAAEARFDAVLLPAPLGWRRLVGRTVNGSLQSLELFFRAVADRAPLPIVLWSEASFGGFSQLIEMVGELAAHPNVIGMIDADLTVERLQNVSAATAEVRREMTVTAVFAAVTRRMLLLESEAPATFVPADRLTGGLSVAVAPPKPAIKTRTKSVGFQTLAAGAASQIIPMLEVGAAGAMPELAVCVPQACHEVLAAFKDGNADLARLKASRLAEADEVLHELGVAGLKYGCDLNGYYGGAPLLPRVGLTASERARVEAALRDTRN